MEGEEDLSTYARTGLKAPAQILQGPFLNLSLDRRIHLARVALVEGELYNYPSCCITNYVNDLLAGWKPASRRWITHSLKGLELEYVLCETHATQLVSRLIGRELPDAPV